MAHDTWKSQVTLVPAILATADSSTRGTLDFPPNLLLTHFLRAIVPANSRKNKVPLKSLEEKSQTMNDGNIHMPRMTSLPLSLDPRNNKYIGARNPARLHLQMLLLKSTRHHLFHFRNLHHHRGTASHHGIGIGIGIGETAYSIRQPCSEIQ